MYRSGLESSNNPAENRIIQTASAADDLMAFGQPTRMMTAPEDEEGVV